MEKTAGQVAYEAWTARHGRPAYWANTLPWTQETWERVAQAAIGWHEANKAVRP